MLICNVYELMVFVVIILIVMYSVIFIIFKIKWGCVRVFLILFLLLDVLFLLNIKLGNGVNLVKVVNNIINVVINI